jgi:hypothetical protein
VLSRVFVPKREEVTEEWRKLHIEQLHNCSYLLLQNTVKVINPRELVGWVM